ncbi:MAG: hypothetical protein AB8I08_00385 [Sandaracinaceae bacterium]
MHFAFEGGGGEVIALSMRHVYADVIEGVPTRAINGRHIQNAKERAAQMHHAPVHLVVPTQRPCGPPGQTGAPTRFTLPRTECIARLRGSPISPDAEFAELVVVWYQDTLTTEPPAEVAAHLRQVQWRALAQNVYW